MKLNENYIGSYLFIAAGLMILLRRYSQSLSYLSARRLFQECLIRLWSILRSFMSCKIGRYI